MYRRLRELRKKRGLSQRTLAELLGVSQQTYSRYERGRRRLSVQAAVTLAQLYHVSVDYLLEITDESKPHW